MPSQFLMDPTLSLPTRIESDDEVRAYVDAIDMGPLKQRLMNTHGWSLDQCDRSERRYKDWLLLVRRHQGESMPPPPDIDEVWHGHVLDTVAYCKDSNAIFGVFLHHVPYSGERGPEDQVLHSQAMLNTQRRWKEAFGVEL